MEPNAQDILDLRAKFFQKIEEENKEFHPRDTARVSTDDDWLRRFLIHHDLDQKEALAMLLDTCEWRFSKGVNEMSEPRYLSEGSLFVHSQDRDGKPLFVFKCKKHVKGQKDLEELKKCVIYWFERVERQEKANMITIFFDMADTGLANMDMEYTKYLINLCKSYYPHFLNYILIYEMPWVLNAAFKIIKSWLPTKAVQKIKFVNKHTLWDFVEPDKALKCWGGNDDWEFSFQAESDTSRHDESKKKVHFADGSPMSDGPTGFGDSRTEEFNAGQKVKITPHETMIFNSEGMDLVGNLVITNTSEHMITYKVKTTSPEKFRVKPSCGLLSQGGSTHIAVVLQAGYAPPSILRDKFLVMTFPLLDSEPLPSSSEVNDLWKNCDMSKVDNHRLRCMVSGLPGALGATTGNHGSHSATNPTDLEQKMSQLLLSMNHISECNAKLAGDVKFSLHLNWVMMFLIGMIGASLFYVLNTSGQGFGQCPSE